MEPFKNQFLKDPTLSKTQTKNVAKIWKKIYQKNTKQFVNTENIPKKCGKQNEMQVSILITLSQRLTGSSHCL